MDFKVLLISVHKLHVHILYIGTNLVKIVSTAIYFLRLIRNPISLCVSNNLL